MHPYQVKNNNVNNHNLELKYTETITITIHFLCSIDHILFFGKQLLHQQHRCYFL